MPAVSAAEQITRRANSNLAFALLGLPATRRHDARVFYAFCRKVDDLADEPDLPLETRRAGLDEWAAVLRGERAPADELQREMLDLRERHDLPAELPLAIIEGCRMDLDFRRFETRRALAEYTWKVACAVGLVSIRLFGCREPAAETYAVELGHALQLTNILRDVAEDHREAGRIYLPKEDFQRSGYREEDLAASCHDARFVSLMEGLAEEAEKRFAEAAACLPAADRKALLPARVMAEMYHRLLRRMRADGFRVFEKRYRLSLPGKSAILLKHLVASRLGLE